MDEIYSEIILDLHKNPVNFGKLEKPNIHVEGGNPLCGDQVQFDVIIENNLIKDIRFSGEGCAISRASESLLTELVKGKSIDVANKLTKDDIFEVLGNIIQTRIKCALLGLFVLQKGLEVYKKNPAENFFLTDFKI